MDSLINPNLQEAREEIQARPHWEGAVAWARGVASGCPAPWWCCVQGPRSGPCFCRNGSWVLIFLYLTVHNLSQLHMHAIPYNFSVFCCWRRQLSRCKPCSKGSQVPVCLKSANTVLIFLYEVPGVVKSIRTESRVVLARGRGEGGMGVLT